MIFSSNIFKIVSGENASLFAEDSNTLSLFLYDKYMKNYKVSLKNDRNCVFNKSFTYKKIIQINSNQLALASNGYITLSNLNEI